MTCFAGGQLDKSLRVYSFKQGKPYKVKRQARPEALDYIFDLNLVFINKREYK
jgi:hypothetical protein